jgi:hypothetical protein
VPLTVPDAALVALVEALPGADEAMVRELLACTDAERALVIQSLKDAAKMPDPSAWTVFLGVLKTTADLVNLVLPFESAIATVYGIAHPG